MSCESMKLPLIDLSNLGEDDSTRWESAKIEIREALQEYGCFEATFDHIPLELRKSVLDGIQQLFDLPLPIKLRNKSDKPYHGYVGQSPFVPLFESMGIDGALSPQIVDTFTNLIWSQGNPTFSKNIQLYCEKLSELDKIVRRVVVESLGLEKYGDEHMKSTDYVCRVQKYAAPRSPHTTLGLIPHTDKNIVTILHQLNHVRGLQILTKDGKNWIAADPTSLNSFVVMIGTSFHAWTNGRLHAPYHRVMVSGDEARYSIGLFSNPKAGCVIKAPEEMVDEDHPLLYKPFDYFKFVEFFYTDFAECAHGILWSLNSINICVLLEAWTKRRSTFSHSQSVDERKRRSILDAQLLC